MNEPSSPDLGSVEGLVRSCLDRETARTDATDLLARIRSDAAASPDENASFIATAGQTFRQRWPRRFAWSALSVAAVVIAFFGGRYFSPASASAATILRSVRTAHAGGGDRCYRVQFAPDPRYWDGKNKFDGPSESVLWTRGDRFWSDCSIGEHKLKIGRDEDRTLWVSPSRSKGIRFPDAASPLPTEVVLICAINSMTVPSLVDDVLKDFDLRAEAPTGNSDSPSSLIWAKLKPGREHPLLSAAMLEIDAQSDILVRVVLWMLRDGRPNGTVTYTLLDQTAQDDVQYRLESHLDPDASIEIHSFQKPAKAAGEAPAAGP